MYQPIFMYTILTTIVHIAEKVISSSLYIKKIIWKKQV